MRDINIAITAASYSGNKGAAAMLQSSIKQLYKKYGHSLNINLMSVYPSEDKKQLPFDFVKVVPCKPQQLLFVAFPLAVLYKLFGWFLPIKKLIEKNKIIRAYKNTDLVIDEAGISFVDSRGIVMNTYAFVCAAVPMLVGTPVVKYSQAMGSFKNPINRILAKIILPKIKLICARGEETFKNLNSINIKENVRLCADGAFTMPDDEIITAQVEKQILQDGFFNDNVVGVSISSVVNKKCNKLNIDYKAVMVKFIDTLNQSGYKVFIVANAARINSQKPRNNDLLVCDEVFACVKNKEMTQWIRKEMTAEEIRCYIRSCRYLVASRFHAMIGALESQVPVLLVGWSHKYKEVLDMFNLGQYAIDFSKLSADSLLEEFDKFVSNEELIRSNLKENIEKVKESSSKNIKYICSVIDDIISKSKRKKNLFDYSDTERYLGKHIACRKSYAAEEDIRKNAASGGTVTALLEHLLDTKQIDGAFVTRSKIENGELSYLPMIATSSSQLRDCSSSIYMDMPLLKHIDMIKNFNGKLAVVLTPCLMSALDCIMEKDSELKGKIVLKLALYCSGNHSKEATALPLKKKKISLENATRIYYRRGHWRGNSSVIYSDNSQKDFSYSKTICAYKNAYFFEKSSCMTCQDHFAKASDISFGDIWLKEIKKENIKQTGCVIRNQKAMDMYLSAVKAGKIIDSHISDNAVIKSQKRALVFKFNCASAKVNSLKKQGKSVEGIEVYGKAKWNQRLAFFLAERNRKMSINHPKRVERLPLWFVYYYMCFIRVLLSF